MWIAQFWWHRNKDCEPSEYVVIFKLSLENGPMLLRKNTTGKEAFLGKASLITYTVTGLANFGFTPLL
jgi:hypothetical protein